jgi:hypothetical protein
MGYPDRTLLENRNDFFLFPCRQGLQKQKQGVTSEVSLWLKQVTGTDSKRGDIHIQDMNISGGHQ